MRLDKQSNKKAWDIRITSDTAFTAFLGLLFCAPPVHERPRKTSARARRAARDNQKDGSAYKESEGEAGARGKVARGDTLTQEGWPFNVSLSRRSLSLSRPSLSHTHTHTRLLVCTQSVSPLLPAKTCLLGDLLRDMSTRTQDL